jgi:acetamidase/formamidase
LDPAFKQVLLEMIAFICHRTHFTPAQAYKSCSLAVDFRIMQTREGENGEHGLLPKG